MYYSKQHCLADIILDHPRVMYILERFGVPLGLENKSIERVCREHHILPELFTLVINVSTFDHFIPPTSKSYDFIPQLLRYLSSSHRYFVEWKIPEVDQNMAALIEQIGEKKAKSLHLLFKHYIAEVSEHIQYENEIVFKYIQELFRCYQQNAIPDKDISYRIGVYGAHHDDIESVLMDVKNLLIRHIPQSEEGALRRRIIQQLFELESDLYSHTRLENEVLIPLIQNLEREIKLR